MAKKSTARAPAAAAAAVILPDGLAELMVAASAAAITTARAAAEADGKPGESEATAAAVAAAELLVKANDTIDDWFVQYVAARLAAADTEAERQLSEKRAALKTLLEEIEAKRTEAATALEALKNTPAATEENGGGGDTAIPAALPAVAVPEGMVLITVIGPATGLRRAGHQFNANPLPVVVTPEQKALIAADPQLSLVDMQAEIDREYDHNKSQRLGVAAFSFDPHGFTAVKVLGPKAGRRRAGHSFGPEGTIVRVGREELAELLEDGTLAVGQA